MRRGRHPPGADRQDVKAIERRRARSSLRRLVGSRKGSCTALSLPLPALRGERVGVRGSSIRERRVRNSSVPCPSPEIPASREFRPLPAKSGARLRDSAPRRKTLTAPSPRPSRGEGGVRGSIRKVRSEWWPERLRDYQEHRCSRIEALCNHLQPNADPVSHPKWIRCAARRRLQ